MLPAVELWSLNHWIFSWSIFALPDSVALDLSNQHCPGAGWGQSNTAQRGKLER